MPFALNYGNLVTTLENYMQRYDDLITSNIPLWVLLGQTRIVREMKLLGFRTEITANFPGSTLTTGILQKPSDWRKTISFYVGIGTGNNDHSPVFERTYEYIRTVYPTIVTGDIPSVPRFYGDADYNHWIVGPAPDQTYPFKVAYYGTLVFIDEVNQVNWITQNAPDLLIYACLLESIPFVKADERIPVWQGLYANAKAALQAQDLEGLYDGQVIVGEPPPTPQPGR